jgi:thiamine pyrophosphate-dependent acetolactate synthase large subunit-like protein
MAKTTADLVIERLIDWGVDTIFGIPGDGINPLMEALRTHRERIRFVQVRHEESAAIAACGHAKYTGRLGACIATSGPGGIHLLNGLYDAKLDLQPVVAITGHTFHDLIGTRYQQDVNLERVFSDVAVYSELIMGPSHAENAVDEGVRRALTQRGVACFVIPKDTQAESSDGHHSRANVPGHSGEVFAPIYQCAPQPDLEAAARILNAGSRVAILAGAGALGARDELEQLAELVGGPIIKPLLGKAAVPDTSPYTTGGIGLIGTLPSQEALEECDTLLIAGSSFPYIEYYPRPGQAKAVQIDIDSSRIGLRYPVDVGLPGDAREVLRALLPLVHRKEDRSFLLKAQAGMRKWRKGQTEQGMRRDMPMKPQVVAYELDKLLDDDAIVSADSGTIATWAARYIQIRPGMKFSLSGTLATMANGLPYSIAAQVAFPERQVVAIVGDGGFTMLMGELATCVKYNLPVKIVIYKNNMLGEIRWEQLIFEGNPEYGVELQPIDFAKAAEAFGAAGYTIERPEDAAPVLRQALSHPGPAVVQAVVDPNEPPWPPKISLNQAVKFGEALLRGEPNRGKLALTVVSDKVRRIV